jgi:tRNA(Ile)-lysidine synthase
MISRARTNINRQDPLEAQFLVDSFEAGEVVLIGVSGGADSMVLLELLARAREQLDISVQALHVNYGLRGRASLLDERLVQRRCRELNVFLTIERSRDLTLGDGNLEERAREIRQAAFKETAREIGASSIALGHTRDDQAETILMHLLRGSGLAGLRAMSARDGAIVRPLLKVRRAEVRDYAHERGIAYRDDATNNDLHFTRNRIRHLLVPMLTEEFNPNLVNTLTESVASITEDQNFLDEMAELIYRRFVKENVSQKKVSIKSLELLELPAALQRRVVRSMMKSVLPRRGRVGHMSALDAALTTLKKHNEGVRLSLGEGLTLMRSKGTIFVYR